MSTFNEDLKWVDLAVKSILDQTYSKFEFIIIVDNPDNTELIEFIKEKADADSRINLLINEKNMGLVFSLNKALKHCKGEYIARMDADDIADTDRIQLQIEYLENKNLDLVFSSIIYIDENGKEFSRTNSNTIESNKVKRLMSISNISTHPTWFSKNKVYDSLNGYRDIRYCEDYDFSLRAITSDFKIGKMPDYTLKYRVRNSSISQSNIYEQYLISKIVNRAFNENRISDVNQIYNEIKELKEKISPGSKENFSKMEKNYLNSIIKLKEKKYLKGLYCIIKALVYNKYGINRYIDLVKMKLLK